MVKIEGMKRIRFYFLLAGCTAVVSGLLLPAPAGAQSRAPWEQIEAAVTLLAEATPRTGAIHLDLPAVTQDGSSVPLTVEVESPMSPEDHVEVLYLFASGNPSPEVAEIRFSPLAGQARLATRIRLDGSQAVVALARTNRGEWLAGARDVRVTVSGCLSQNSSLDAADFMRARVRAPNRVRRGEPPEIRTLINHPMETGLRKDGQGRPIPERILQAFRAELGDEMVIAARFYRAISANPYLLFHVAPGRPGTIHLHWEEDTGRSISETAQIPSA